MNKKAILIQSFFKPSIAVVLENEKILSVLLDIEGSEVESIYKARVTTIQKGINACFVSLGNGKSGFLNFNDVPPNVEIKPNVFIMVKVKKNPLKYKSPQLSAFITLAGKYLVLLTYENTIKLSNKIENIDTKFVIKTIIENIREDLKKTYPGIENVGFIARTSSQYADPLEIKKDMEILYKTWNNILKDFQKSYYERLLYRDQHFPIKVVREFFDPQTNIIVDNKEDYDEIKRYISNYSESYVNMISYFNPLKVRKNLLEYYNINLDFDDFVKHKVNLSIGGYLIIQHSELGTVIDVNSGSYIGTDTYETYRNVNLAAAKEIVKQIRLRDISGIILVDFLKIQDEERKDKVNQEIIEELEKELKDEKKRIKIWGFTNLGILEITRQRTEEGNYEKMTSKCRCCNGSGYVLSPKFQVTQIVNSINSYIIKLFGSKEKVLFLEISSELIPYFIEDFMINEYYKLLEQYGFKLVVKSFMTYYYIYRNFKYRIKPLQSLDNLRVEDFPAVDQVIDVEAWMIQELSSKRMYSLYKGFPVVIDFDLGVPFEGLKALKVKIAKVVPFYYIEGVKV